VANPLKREAGGEIETTVVSFRRSVEAIDAFAGADREAASSPLKLPLLSPATSARSSTS
jgi:hypothetical protein